MKTMLSCYAKNLNVYVGLSRARSFLGVTVERQSPQRPEKVYGLALTLAIAVAAAFWNSRRTSLASLLGKLARCTIRT